MKSKAPLMLMEQMVMLLVFAIAAALCLQGFVKSSEISELSKARDMAVLEAQNAAEAVINGSEEEYLAEKGALFTENGGTINYDDFTLELTYTDSGLDNMISADISVYTADGEKLFGIPAARQTGGGEPR